MTPDLIIPPVLALLAIAALVLLLRRALRKNPQRLAELRKKGEHDLRTSAVVSSSKLSGGPLRKVKEYFSSEEGGEKELSIAEREKMLIKRIAADPADVEAYELLGQVYLVQGNFVDAKECYQQVLVIKPQHPTALKKLRRIKKLIDEQRRLG